MDTQITIRPYSSQDFDSIIGLLRLNTPKYFAPEEEASLIHYLNHELEYYFVAVDNNTVVRCGGINLVDSGKTARISWDIIHPDYQGKGVGSILTKHRLAFISTLSGIEKTVVRTSQLAYPFYEKFGFKTTEVIKDYWAEGLDMWVMEL